MTNSKKPQNHKTNASATELEESQLDNVEGGAAYLKLGDSTGESGFDGKGNDLAKVTLSKKLGYTENDSRGKGNEFIKG